jgi:beta-glucosidase
MPQPHHLSADPAAESNWMDPKLSPTRRTALLLNALTFEQKIHLALASHSEQGQAALEEFNIPRFACFDGPNGVRGETGITVFPAAQALSATFNRDLAEAYGQAVAEEVRGKGGNTWLGPALDIARTPLSGRQAEALGEDPYLAGQIAAAEVKGAKALHVLTMLKHFIANNQEYMRTGFAGAPPFGPHSPAVNVIISEKALQEIYYPPVKQAIQEGGTGSVMISYNRVNGLQACEHPHVLGTLRNDWGFHGFTAPDFGFAVRDPLAAAQAGIDLPALSDKESAGRTAEMFTSGQISTERLDDICRRILFAYFDAGLFDHPVTPAVDNVSTQSHRDLAARIAEESIVLLKNQNAVLPLPAAPGISIAVIGPAGEDVQWMIGGSAGVIIAPENMDTPLAGITARAGSGAQIHFSQGSLGDVPLPAIPEAVITPPSGAGSGMLGQYWNNAAREGSPVLERVEPSLEKFSKPAEVSDFPWSARWSGTITPPASGAYRFSMLAAGIAHLSINGQRVASGYREATRFFFGPQLPIQGIVDLDAGVPAAIQIDYCSGSALFGGELTLGWQPPDASLIPAAVEAARQADFALVFANTATGEGMDRSTLALPGDQDALIQAVAAANPKTVVVLNTGGPVLMPWLDQVTAVIQAWYPGQCFGSAIAAVLFGDTDPSGRLPVTFPASDQQGPAPASHPELYPGVDGTVLYSEGVMVGYRWYDQFQQSPLFPFGHGLSYADFEYSELLVNRNPNNGEIKVAVLVQNISSRKAAVVVQVYVTHPSAAGEPPVQLKRFQKGWLDAGKRAAVSFVLQWDDLLTYDETSGKWSFLPGLYTISVGSSSRDLHCQHTLEIHS